MGACLLEVLPVDLKHPLLLEFYDRLVGLQDPDHLFVVGDALPLELFYLLAVVIDLLIFLFYLVDQEGDLLDGYL